jgi:hypothetical protein
MKILTLLLPVCSDDDSLTLSRTRAFRRGLSSGSFQLGSEPLATQWLTPNAGIESAGVLRFLRRLLGMS